MRGVGWRRTELSGLRAPLRWASRPGRGRSATVLSIDPRAPVPAEAAAGAAPSAGGTAALDRLRRASSIGDAAEEPPLGPCASVPMAISPLSGCARGRGSTSGVQPGRRGRRKPLARFATRADGEIFAHRLVPPWPGGPFSTFTQCSSVRCASEELDESSIRVDSWRDRGTRMRGELRRRVRRGTARGRCAARARRLFRGRRYRSRSWPVDADDIKRASLSREHRSCSCESRADERGALRRGRRHLMICLRQLCRPRTALPLRNARAGHAPPHPA